MQAAQGRGKSRGRPTVSIAVRDAGLRSRLLELLAGGQVATEELRANADLREAIDQSGSDLVVVAHAQIAAEDELAQLAEQVEQGIVVVTEKDAGPGDRARLLAAGALDVIELGERAAPASARAAQVAKIEKLAEAAAPAVVKVPDVGGAVADPKLADFLSRSPRMGAFLDMVHRIVDADAALLITGETGVGKERLARAIHAESPRAAGPFVAVNCGALPEGLLESELFGHEKGAFTGAAQQRRGHFETAHRGTIFLDEIGELPSHLQVKLLTVLQRHEVRRVGGTAPVRVDVRVMAATNRDLEREVAAGRFREDLFYRLNVVPLQVPKLSERPEDIPDLVGHFIRYFREKVPGAEVRGITDAAIEAMLRYHWPGNVRELINVIERAVLLARKPEISIDDLPPAFDHEAERAVGVDGGEERADAGLERPLREVRDEAIARAERRYLVRLLGRTRGRIGETARRAGLKPRSLHDKMKRYGLRKEDYR